MNTTRLGILTPIFTLGLWACGEAPISLDGVVVPADGPALAQETTAIHTVASALDITQLGPEPSPAAAPQTLVSGAQVNEYNDQHGRSVVMGDFNGDGYRDLAVGVPFEDIGSTESAGAVIIYRGSGAGLVYSEALTQGALGNDEHFDHFGFALAAADMDGDGRDDLAVGAPDEAVGSDPASGAVFVFRGSGGNMVPAWVLSQASLGLDTNEAGDRFGEALSAGDYDGDGRADLAIGAPGEGNAAGVRSGVVYVARGQPLGVAPVGGVKLGQSGLGSPDAYDRFGSTLASGNVVGSAHADLLVGCYNDREGPRSGAVFVFQGAAAGLAAHSRLVQPSMNERSDQFGKALAVGDFSGDGRADLAVGAPGENRATGAVYLYNGGAAALTFDEVVDGGALPGAARGDRFGAALAAGDYNGDNRADLVVASPRAVVSTAGSVRQGRLHVLRSQGTTLAAIAPLTRAYFGVGAADDQFGMALAMGRANSLGHTLIVAGAPARTQGVARSGSVFVYRGTSNAVPSAWRRLVQAL